MNKDDDSINPIIEAAITAAINVISRADLRIVGICIGAVYITAEDRTKIATATACPADDERSIEERRSQASTVRRTIIDQLIEDEEEGVDTESFGGVGTPLNS